ncbi:MAG: sugar kinase [Candidatus Omnitrophica bacterium]|nr:sugar kinase [Candidatus Omnitrophota bacterium]
MVERRILAVGSVALDTVRTPFGRVKDALGGSATYFSMSARFFSPVAVVAVVGRDFPPRHLRLLESAGVDTSGIETDQGGRTFRWSGYYDFDLNTAHTLKTELNVFQSFRPKLSEMHKRARHLFLANIDPDLQMRVRSQMRNAAFTACDTMNFWIENKKKSVLALLKKVEIFLCNEAEARELSGEFNLMKAARWMLAKGPQLVVIKKGEHGVVCVSRNFVFLAPAYLLEKVFDPTGAGDTFAGGFIGHLSKSPRLNLRSVRQAVVYGSVLASYNVESFSLERVAALKPRQIRRRYRQFREMTEF